MTSSTAHATADPALEALVGLLDGIVAVPALHARFLNTLARMEYVGVRKMLKARDSARLDREGLQHVVEEAGHALRLKKMAEALSPEPGLVAGFDEPHTLAGARGEDYLQRVDAACERVLVDRVPEAGRAELNYLLSSLVIELRAEAFYPRYESVLRAHGAGLSVASIVRDELRHLAEMRASLEGRLAELEVCLGAVESEEAAAFGAWVDGVRRACQGAVPAHP